MTTAPVNGDDLLARIKPQLKEQRVQICLRPDLIQEWEQAEDELQKAQAMPSQAGRLGDQGDTSARALAERVKELEDQIEAASAWFVFRALPASEFRALCAENPPRPTDQFDLIAGYDREAIADLLVRKCLVDPTFTDEGWATFMETCTPSEWAELRDGVMNANGGSFTPGKSLLASRVLDRSVSD